jgi:hypothetical protein
MYPSRSAVSRIWEHAFLLILEGSLKAKETAVLEYPLSRAISLIVGRFLFVVCSAMVQSSTSADFLPQCCIEQ